MAKNAEISWEFALKMIVTAAIILGVVAVLIVLYNNAPRLLGMLA